MSSKVLTLHALSPADLREHARRRFVRLRHELGWTQLRASMELGVACSTVERWEDRRNPTTLPAWALVAVELSADGAACVETKCSALKPVRSRRAGPPVTTRRAA